MEKIYKYNWATLLYRRNEHSLVNQLHFHKIKKTHTQKKTKPTSNRQKWLDVGRGHEHEYLFLFSQLIISPKLEQLSGNCFSKREPVV